MFLLFVQLSDSALVPIIKNHPQLKPRASKTYIVHTNHHAKPPHFTNLEHWYHSMVAAHSHLTANTSKQILYTYDTALHGFAVELTGDEAQRMSTAFGVIGMYEDRIFYPQTTRSPGFLDLNPQYGAWNMTDFGDGIIIGIIDSGIWPESSSFNDHGLGPVRSSWRGKCVDADDFNASLCNNKLVGAKAFSSSADAMAAIKSSRIPSPRDKLGHGTHVASTAAGAEVPDAGLYTFSQGTARGMAPKARIAMYKVCDDTGCWGADIAAAVETAVKDGVDIISMSLGGLRDSPFYDDVIAVSTFGAERKGIFVAMAGENFGPAKSSVGNVAPWMTTVGAATIDRLFPANLTLGNGVVLEGQSLRVDYNIISGTSMACPHVAGIAALIKKKYPSWTPAMIRSALMTTAGTFDNRGRHILDNGVANASVMVATPLATGAGHIRPNLALDPGLVYDAGVTDYIDFMCTLNYTAEQLRLLMPNFVKCTRTLPGGPADLNYPSFVVIFNNRTAVRTLTRTVTAVSEKVETYNVTYAAPEHVKVTITPTTLEFKKPNERKSYTVEFRNLERGNAAAGWDFGHISWENNDHVVRSPVAFQWKN
ncbi:hypothetical protein QOZ80_7BG0605680 [Eleusine coracana subsp. coracana]|nr:hypothetical protein QOZ80_7BG0605680 [Eleusine coracana subsp. coracana]